MHICYAKIQILQQEGALCKNASRNLMLNETCVCLHVCVCGNLQATFVKRAKRKVVFAIRKIKRFERHAFRRRGVRKSVLPQNIYFYK